MSETGYAILIGNSEFPSESDEYGLFASENISVLKNQTRQKIEDELYERIKTAKKDDLVLIYYSGHGKLNKAQRLHLATYDTEVERLERTALSTRYLAGALEDFPHNRVILILDCCYAGHIETDINKSGSDDVLPESLGGCGTYIVTATAKFQTAKELNNDRNGLLTKHLLAGIQNGAADYKQSGFITIGELFEYAEPRVQEEASQKPKMWALKADGGGINIARSGREPQKQRAERIYKKLAQLVSDGHSEFIKILSEADLLLKQPAEELDDIQQRRNELLDQLDQEQLSSHDFYLQWHLLETLKPGPDPDPEPEPTPLPEPPVVTEPDNSDTIKPDEKKTKPPWLIPMVFVAVIAAVIIVTVLMPMVVKNPATDNSLVPKMVHIKKGTFMMGSPKSEKGDSDEKQHEVTVGDFQIGQYEVTIAEFRRFVEAMNYKTEAEQYDGCYDWTGSEWEKDKNYNWQNVGFEQADDHPVVCVSWNDAMAYIDWLNEETNGDYRLNEETNGDYRLPTEAEWEYAARAGTETGYWWGDTDSHDKANYGKDKCCKGLDEGRDKWFFTAPIGSFDPNPWDLYDTVGNVWEWTCSKYELDYDGAEKSCMGKNNANDESATRAIRSGSWNDTPTEVRAAARTGGRASYRSINIGFRLARSPNLSSSDFVYWKQKVKRTDASIQLN